MQYKREANPNKFQEDSPRLVFQFSKAQYHFILADSIRFIHYNRHTSTAQESVIIQSAASQYTRSEEETLI